jgi:hypothetical protein
MFPSLPADTARAAADVFNIHNIYLSIGDRIDELLADMTPADLDVSGEQPPGSLAMLALVTCFQYAENIPDRQAADAVRTRMDWKYALHLGLSYPGFDPTVLCEFRQRLMQDPPAQWALDHILAWLGQIGLFASRERRQATAMQVIGRVCRLTRLEQMVAAIHQTLEALAAAQPEWLRAIAPAQWLHRYTSTSATMSLPGSREEQERMAQSIGIDALYLLDAISHAHKPELNALPEVQSLRRMWPRHFEKRLEQVGWRGSCWDQCRLLDGFAHR